MLSLIPIKDWIYLGAILALLAGFGVFVHHERTVGAAHEIAALQQSSQKLQAAADAKVAQLTAQHTADITANKVVYETQLTALSSQRASDAQRLREYDAYRRARPSVPDTANGPGAATVIPGSAVGSVQRDERLEQVALDLANAAGDAAAALKSCMAERDTLAGK